MRVYVHFFIGEEEWLVEYIYVFIWEMRGQKQQNGRAYLAKATEGRGQKQIWLMDIGE